tara:strand:- start:695 stop:901 length:207 start_codon:yes stop_codon:yes gene_type:complete
MLLSTPFLKQVSGDIFFDGKPIDPEVHSRIVSYVSQEDNHLPALTVRQTLAFAGQTAASKKGRDEKLS